MRRAIIWTLVLAATFVAGLKIGGYVQHQKTGYAYRIRSEKSYASTNGTVHLEYATESVGIPFLDPGTSTIVLREPSGLEAILYKARRGFQESYPYPEELVVANNQIRWDDGWHYYTLQLEASRRRNRRENSDDQNLENTTQETQVTPTQKHAEQSVEREPE